MIDQRKSLSVADKLGTFKKFSTKYARIGKVGGALGNVADVYSTYSDYQDSSLSTARFSYRLGGTATSIGASSVVGAELGGPYGAAAGFVVGLGTTAGEIIYDGWNNTILPTISNFTYNFNGYLHR